MLALFYILPLVQAYVKEGPLVNIVSEADYEKFLTDFYAQARVILLYVPYETTSREVSPAFFATSKALMKEEAPIKLAKLDITTAENRKILEKLDPRPTTPGLVYYLANSTKHYSYESATTQAVMKSAFLDLLPRVHSFAEVEEFNEYFNVSSHRAFPLVLGKFAEFTGPQYDLFQEFIKENAHRFTFGLVKDSGQWSSRFEVTEDAIIILPTPVLSVFRDKPQYSLTTFDSFEAISTFVEAHAHMFFKWITKETERFVLAPHRPLGIFLGDFDPAKNAQELRDFVTSFERKVRVFFTVDFETRRMLFAIGNRQHFKKELVKLGVEKDQLLFMIKSRDDYYVLRDYEMRYDNGTLNTQAIGNFSHAFKEHRLQPYVRTTPPPANEYENGVRVAVGQTFQEIVMNKAVDQLVLVHDSGQKQSKEAVLAVEAFAAKYSHPEEFEVVKIDGVTNAVPSPYERSQRPILFFAQKNSKNLPKVYSGTSFTYNDLVNFVKPAKEDL